MTTTADRWKLTGKTALVTGATKGIGRAIADELLLLGARVCGVARAEDDVRAWERDCREAGHDAVGVAADMTEDDGRRRALDAVTGRFGGRLDILVNNVGTNVRKATLDYTDDEYGHVLRTNLDSVWSLCRAAHPLLRASGEASVVNISSVAGAVSVHSGLPYAVSKAALDQLTRYLAVEWAGDRIRVNAVAPWYTKTPLASPVLDKPEFTAGVLERTPLGRIADPEDVSGIAAFLCLPVATHITGQVVAVDGGFLAFGF